MTRKQKQLIRDLRDAASGEVVGRKQIGRHTSNADIMAALQKTLPWRAADEIERLARDKGRR